MLLKFWTALILSLGVWGPQHSSQDPGSSSKCVIQADPHPQYVAAYRMHYQGGRSCFFNRSSVGSAGSQQWVHVINVKPTARGRDLTARTPVTLHILPRDLPGVGEADGEKKGGGGEQKEGGWMFQFVLNSQHPVKWKVEVSPTLPPHASLRFMFQSDSRIHFRKRKGQPQFRVRRRSMPSADNEKKFLSWVGRRFKAVTSYSELTGDKLLFYLGTVAAASPECRLNEMQASTFALTAQKEQQPVRGCVSTGTKNVVDRPVYVIELLGEGPGDEGGEGERQVELDIRSASGRKMEHDFYLVLRSPPSVRWVLRTHRVNGWIDVVTNADADLRGIRMHTVALRRELMDASGLDLIHWTEYYVAPVRAYTSVTAANILQLLLPSSDAKSPHPWEPPVQPSKDANRGKQPPRSENPSTDMRDHLKHIIQTRCEGGVMEIALPAVLTQELDLPMEQLSLLDGDCRPTKNSTHVIFRTALDHCRTSKISVDDQDVYSNAIVIQASGMVGAILEEELGSGYFDLQGNSGSGWMEDDDHSSSTTYVDDEDFASHRVEIDVECRLPRSDGPHKGWRGGAGGQEGGCRLGVYADPLFQKAVTLFPHTTSTGVYLQASPIHDPQLHVLMENCWVSPWSHPQHSDPQRSDPQHSDPQRSDPQHSDPQQMVLIQQGCTRSPGVRWVRYHTGGATSQEETTPERLMIYRDLPQGSYVHCQLARCFKGSSLPGHKCPPDPSDHCNSNVLPNLFPQLQTRPCGIHTVGPLHITDREVRIGDDPQLTGTVTPDHQGKSPRSQGEGQLQQSVIIEGLDSGTVVGIAFAAFAIGILLTGALWFIHTHTGPSKRSTMSAVSMGGMSGDVTPNSSSPISA